MKLKMCICKWSTLNSCHHGLNCPKSPWSIRKKNKMKLFKEDGFPTKAGIEELKSVQKCLDELFEKDSIRAMSIGQIRTLGSWLAKMVGDTLSKQFVKTKQ